MSTEPETNTAEATDALRAQVTLASFHHANYVAALKSMREMLALTDGVDPYNAACERLGLNNDPLPSTGFDRRGATAPPAALSDLPAELAENPLVKSWNDREWRAWAEVHSPLEYERAKGMVEVMTEREMHRAWRKRAEEAEALVSRLAADAERMKTAITSHHAQKADDRCIEDDDRLYAAAGLPPCDRRVGDKAAMLANCKRFIERRCEGGGWPTYRELEEEVKRLRERNAKQ